MRKIIWACWFQGRRAAPELVRRCLQSWEERNPGWDIRCLDANTIPRYLNLSSHIDLTRQSITAASLSDILRVLLLHEYGGVWVDATTFCNMPLDDWLLLAANTGFFAFARPSEDRSLASWFLAAEPGNSLLAKWAGRVIRYWQVRERSLDYFWLHHQFGELCSIDKQAFRAWQRVPRITADGAHSIQKIGIYEEYDQVNSKIDWTVPLFKLTHRLDASRFTPNCLIARLLGMSETDAAAPPACEQELPAVTRPIGLLNVCTDNLGDYIQGIAAENLLQRAGLLPSFLVQPHDGVGEPPSIPSDSEPGVLLNSLFKATNSERLPPSAYRPIYIGFHTSEQATNLVLPAALEHYATHGPVGCRDRHTLSLLRSHGVPAFLSHCLSVTFARRLPDPDQHREVFVVSHDRRILDYLPASISPYSVVSHHASSNEPGENKHRAAELLKTYRDRARLVVTTIVDCALPVIAMGIPVIVFYPPNEELQQQPDFECFSSLSEFVRVFRPSESTLVDWRGYTVDVGALKLKLVDRFFAMVALRWGRLATTPIGPIAPPSILPLPLSADLHHYFDEPERLAELAWTRSPDRQRWRMASSYEPAWADRAKVAAQFIHDGSRVLEIGTGSGALRKLIAQRCRYTGADLEPLDETTLVFDLDNDPIPPGPWDTIALLAVLEYLYHPTEALRKIAGAASRLIISYSCCIDGRSDSAGERPSNNWANSMTERNISDELGALGFRMSGRQLLNLTSDFEEIIFEFTR